MKTFKSFSNKIFLLAIFIIIQYSCQNTKASTSTGLIEKMTVYNLKQNSGCEEDFDSSCLNDDEEMIRQGSEWETAARNMIEITLEEEKEVGKEFHASMVDDYNFIQDSRSKKLEKILRKMKPYVSRKEISYKIFLIENKSAEDRVSNAWTVPGGNIYVTTTILKDIQSDDELANIIGHEIGHNECKHTHAFLQRNKPVETITGLFSEFTGIDVPSEIFTGILSIPLMAFGQKNELQADRTGMYLSNKAGYDPKAGLNFWKRSASGEEKNTIETFLRTHPYSTTRYECGINYLHNNSRN